MSEEPLLFGLVKTIEKGRLTLTWKGVRVEFAKQTRGVPRLKPAGEDLPSFGTVRDGAALEATRKSLADENGQRGVHLAHVVSPSEVTGQEYDIFVYLVGPGGEHFGDPADLSDVVKAEFWLGEQFDPSGYVVENVADRGGRQMGIRTSAYGPVLCMCRVTFTDEHETVLSRYLDFEAGDLLKRAIEDQEG